MSQSFGREDMMSMEEVCEVLGLSRTTVIRRARGGTIPCVLGATRTPLFLRAQIEQWMLDLTTGMTPRQATQRRE